MSAPTAPPERVCRRCGATGNLKMLVNPLGLVYKSWECRDACPTPETAPLDLDALERMLDAASPGPWETGEDGLVWAPRLGDPVSGSTEIPDAELIAALRNAAPRLLRLARAAREWRVAFPSPDEPPMEFVARIEPLAAAVIAAVDALDADAPALPERTWTPGDSPVLPPLPESAYPAGATPLDLDADAPVEPARNTPTSVLAAIARHVVGVGPDDVHPEERLYWQDIRDAVNALDGGDPR